VQCSCRKCRSVAGSTSRGGMTIDRIARHGDAFKRTGWGLCWALTQLLILSDIRNHMHRYHATWTGEESSTRVHPMEKKQRTNNE
jgi:hypothetical protein